MLIGNARYQCSCVRYVTSDELLPLTVGLSVSLGLLLIITVSVSVFITVRRYRHRQQLAAKTSQQTSQYDTVLDRQDLEYRRRLPTLYDDDKEAGL